jgi:zinc protease
MTIRLPGELPYLIMGYKVPVLKNAEEEKDAYALEVLAGILDGGNSARLAGRLIRGSQMAVSAGAGYDLYARMDSLFMFEATPAEGYSLSDLETALKSEISELQTRLVAPEELARVKAQVLANSVFERDSVFYQAMQLGTLETVGLGWKRVDEYEERISQVTAEDVLASAKQFLVEDNLTVCFLDPLPMDRRQADEPGLGGLHAH